ncbi:hypothetical protein BH09PLA1_BH09PLA1_23500 [soil metagenome]
MKKYAAIVSAIVLVSGYIYLKSRPGNVIPLSRISHDLARDLTLMPGSKSAAPFTTRELSDTEPKNSMLMSSSKSGRVLDPVVFDPLELSPSTLPATNPTTNPARLPTTHPAK